MLTQAQLQQHLHYDLDTDILYRISKDGTLKRVIGTLNQNGYYEISILGKTYRLHRVIFQLVHGYLPQQIDHINQVKTDNRVSNLRPATNQQNAANKKMPRNNKSGYKGVVYRAKSKKWQTIIRINGRGISLGLFSTPAEAAEAYNNFALQAFKEYSCLNPLHNRSA